MTGKIVFSGNVVRLPKQSLERIFQPQGVYYAELLEAQRQQRALPGTVLDRVKVTIEIVEP